jgi:hypothetical protein
MSRSVDAKQNRATGVTSGHTNGLDGINAITYSISAPLNGIQSALWRSDAIIRQSRQAAPDTKVSAAPAMW